MLEKIVRTVILEKIIMKNCCKKENNKNVQKNCPKKLSEKM